MAVPAWRRRFAPSIRACGISAAGCTRCEYFREARKRDYDEVKAGAQAIYLAESRAQAVATFRVFGSRWYRAYPAMVRRLQQDLPELLSFFAFPGTCGANCAPPT